MRIERRGPAAAGHGHRRRLDGAALRRTLPRTTRGAEGDADCELTGPVGELYLVAWNRLPYSALSGKGDLSLAQVWREHSRV